MGRYYTHWLCCIVVGCCVTTPLYGQKHDDNLRAEAGQTLKRAAMYYRDKVASHGGYVYYYATDLSERWGEGKATLDTIFVQPPGTPTVGLAYLQAFATTGDNFYLEAAQETALALVYGQLQSGGWTQVIHFGAAKRLGKYRNGKGGSWNVSSLDDAQTQSALEFLIQIDRALNFKHTQIHEATLYGLDALLKAQFANGAFPQVWTQAVTKQEIMKAKFPGNDWKTEGRVKNYWDYYTLNDNLAGSVSEPLIIAHRVYKDEKYLIALQKLGDFLLLAQMPDPQPGWCQQYNYEMLPIWGRKFEPPAITGWESQDAMETLIKIAIYSGKRAYLEPVPKALAYFTQKCLLTDGKVARYYEFKSNKPLYMDSTYRLTYDDTAAPSHYGWKQPARFEQIDAALKAAMSETKANTSPSANVREPEVRRLVQSLDKTGRWVSTYDGERLVGQPKFERGFQFISSAVFSRNVTTLSEYLTQNK